MKFRITNIIILSLFDDWGLRFEVWGLRFAVTSEIVNQCSVFGVEVQRIFSSLKISLAISYRRGAVFSQSFDLKFMA